MTLIRIGDSWRPVQKLRITATSDHMANITLIKHALSDISLGEHVQITLSAPTKAISYTLLTLDKFPFLDYLDDPCNIPAWTYKFLSSECQHLTDITPGNKEKVVHARFSLCLGFTRKGIHELTVSDA